MVRRDVKLSTPDSAQFKSKRPRGDGNVRILAISPNDACVATSDGRTHPIVSDIDQIGIHIDLLMCVHIADPSSVQLFEGALLADRGFWDITQCVNADNADAIATSLISNWSILSDGNRAYCWAGVLSIIATFPSPSAKARRLQSLCKMLIQLSEFLQRARSASIDPEAIDAFTGLQPADILLAMQEQFTAIVPASAGPALLLDAESIIAVVPKVLATLSQSLDCALAANRRALALAVRCTHECLVWIQAIGAVAGNNLHTSATRSFMSALPSIEATCLSASDADIAAAMGRLLK